MREGEEFPGVRCVKQERKDGQIAPHAGIRQL
jgi:hypothetical protein